MLEDPIVTALAGQKGISVGQLVLAWGLQRGYAVIPKSATESRIIANLQAAKIQLSVAEMEQLGSLDKDHHFCNYPWAQGGSGFYNRSVPNC